MNRTEPMLPEDDIRETPHELFAARDAIHNFDLDACATHQNAKCRRYYTEHGMFAKNEDQEAFPSPPYPTYCPLALEFDGLTGSWQGSRVWCNPPFSDIESWVAKAWDSEAEVVDMLVPATRTEQDWWQTLVEPFRDGKGSLVLGWNLTTTFLRGRQHFLKDGGPILGANGKRSSPKFGCVMLTWTRSNPQK